jgi:hypothetical protein
MIEVLVVFPSHSSQLPGYYRFLPNPFQRIIHLLLYHPTLYGLNTDTASLNNPKKLKRQYSPK